MYKKRLISVTMCAATLLPIALGMQSAFAQTSNSSEATTSSQVLSDGMREWEAGTIENPIPYTRGEEIFYKGKVYRVIQSHENTGDLDWAPDIAINLFEYLHVAPGPIDPPTPIIPDIPENAVVLYDDYDGENILKIHEEEEIVVPNLVKDGYNDKISSVRLPAGKTITLYQDVNYQGNSITFTNSSDKSVDYNLTGEYAALNDKISSYKIENTPDIPENAVVFYDNFNEKDILKIHEVPEGESEQVSSLSGESYNDKISSVRVPAGTTVSIYQNVNFKGEVVVLSNTTDKAQVYNLDSSVTLGNALNNQTSSFIISRLPNFDGKVLNLVTALNTKSVLDFATDSNGMVLWDQNEPRTDNQQWKFTKISKDVYSIQSQTYKQGGGYLMESFDGNGQAFMDKGPLQLSAGLQWGCKWRIESAGKGKYHIVNTDTGHRLDVSESSTKNGTEIAAFNPHNNENQKWLLNEAELVVPENAVALYDELDGVKTLVVHTEEELSVPSMETKTNDKVSSVKLPAGRSITLYQDSNYKGTSITLTNNSDKSVVYNLNEEYATLNDKTSSYKISRVPIVPENAVVLYQDKDAVKPLLIHTEEELSVSSLKSESNDKVSSVRLPAGKTITLYKDANYKGVSITIENSSDKSVVYNLNGEYEALNDQTSSYIVGNPVPFDGKSFEIVSKWKQSSVMDNGGSSGIVLWGEHGQENQIWEFVYDRVAKNYAITNQDKGKTQYLYEKSDKSLAFSPPTDSLNKLGDDTRWNLVKVSDGVYEIVNVKTGNLIDIYGATTTANGTKIGTYQRKNADNQKWLLKNPPATETPEYQKKYSICFNENEWSLSNEYSMSWVSRWDFIKMGAPQGHKFKLVSKNGKTGKVQPDDTFYIYSEAYDYPEERWISVGYNFGEYYAYLDKEKKRTEFRYSGGNLEFYSAEKGWESLKVFGGYVGWFYSFSPASFEFRA